MALYLLCRLLVATLVFMQTLAADTSCTDCFVHSRATYYPNSEDHGTDVGACGFGSFGATVNGGDVSAASNLYRNGVGCGACYQVRCTNSAYCSDKGATVVITDEGSSDNTDFILSKRAFGRMAQTTDAAASLLALGVVDIEYRRVACSYPNKNITIKIDESSSNPHYLAFVIWFQQGRRDITAVQLCEVAENLMDMHEECLDGNFRSIELLREANLHQAAHPHVTRIVNDDEDDEEENGDNDENVIGDDNSSNMNVDNVNLVNRPVNGPLPTVASEVDDGWIPVTNGRRRGRQN